MRGTSFAFKLLVTVASLTTALALVTAIVPDWIEELFDAEPDGGSGSLEWLVVGALVLVSVVLWLGVWRVHRRATGPAVQPTSG